MANWQTGVQKNSFDAVGSSKDIMAARASGREDSKVSKHSFSGSDMAGINANEAQNMMRAIEAYVKSLRDKIDKIDEAAKSDKAVKGEMIQAALTAYIAKVKSYCGDLVDYLKAFNDKLEGVIGKWVEQTKKSAEAINGSAGAGGNFADSVGSGYKYTTGAVNTIAKGYGQGGTGSYADANYGNVIGGGNTGYATTPNTTGAQE